MATFRLWRLQNQAVWCIGQKQEHSITRNTKYIITLIKVPLIFISLFCKTILLCFFIAAYICGRYKLVMMISFFWYYRKVKQKQYAPVLSAIPY
jgi:hypothetical protein